MNPISFVQKVKRETSRFKFQIVHNQVSGCLREQPEMIYSETINMILKVGK
jgi:hypothetical protein